VTVLGAAHDNDQLIDLFKDMLSQPPGGLGEMVEATDVEAVVNQFAFGWVPEGF